MSFSSRGTFESRLQTAQSWLSASDLLAVNAVRVFMFGAIEEAEFCLLLAHGGSATGCCFCTNDQEYLAIPGNPIGAVLAVMEFSFVLTFPDQPEANPLNLEEELSRKGVRSARRRGCGHEILEDDQ